MSLYNDLFQYLDTQWASRTKLVWPNTNSDQFSGSYTDSNVVVTVDVFDVGKNTIAIPVTSTAPRTEFYIIQCNIIGDKQVGYGDIYGHAERLDAIFQNQNFQQGDTDFHFEESRKSSPVPDEAKFIVPWSCPFFIINN